MENGSAGKDLDQMASELRNILMSEELPGLPEPCTPATGKQKKKAASGRVRQALPSQPPPLLLELPSWPPQQKRPRRACVARANFKYTFSDGALWPAFP